LVSPAFKTWFGYGIKWDEGEMLGLGEWTSGSRSRAKRALRGDKLVVVAILEKSLA